MCTRVCVRETERRRERGKERERGRKERGRRERERKERERKEGKRERERERSATVGALTHDVLLFLWRSLQKKIEKRERRKLDYDRSKRALEAAQEKNKKGKKSDEVRGAPFKPLSVLDDPRSHWWIRNVLRICSLRVSCIHAGDWAAKH